MNKKPLLILLFIATAIVSSQTNANFYQHYTNHIKTWFHNLFIKKPPKIQRPIATTITLEKTAIAHSNMPLNQALFRRRSIRQFTKAPLSLSQISALLWAGQGITSKKGYRTIPSAGALFPLEIYFVEPDGFWHYLPFKNSIELINSKNLQHKLYLAAIKQKSIIDAPCDIIITGFYERSAKKYNHAGIKYTQMEAGHSAQNILLEATALHLGAVAIGGFYVNRVKKSLKLAPEQTPLYIIPVGHPLKTHD